VKDLNPDERKNRPSASKAKDYGLCIDKHHMERGMPDTTTPEASMGNNIHEALELNDFSKLNREEVAIASACSDDRTTLLDWKWPDWRDNPGTVWLEKRLWYKKDKFSGKADYVAFRGSEAIILDYKTGRIKVDEAPDNKQLMWCMALVDHALRKHKLANITVAISQPPARHFSVYTYERHFITSCKRSISELVNSIDKGNHHNPRLAQGKIQCRYCNAKAECPALGRQSEALPELTSEGTLTPLLLSKALPMLGAIEARCKAIKEQAKKVLHGGEKINGWRLKAGPTRRKVTDTHKVYAVLADSGVQFDDILKAASFSVPKVERLCRERGIELEVDDCIEVTKGSEQLEQFDEIMELTKNIGGNGAKSNTAGGNPDKRES